MRCKQAALAAAVVLAGCGGEPKAAEEQVVRGNGFSFSAPGGWNLERPPRSIAAAPVGGVERVSASVFRLARPYRPALWPTVVTELDGVARKLAAQLGGGAALSRGRTEVVAGRRARVYEIGYSRDGKQRVERVAFLLAGRREFQLSCRWPGDEPDAGKDACALLFRSFRPA